MTSRWRKQLHTKDERPATRTHRASAPAAGSSLQHPRTGLGAARKCELVCGETVLVCEGTVLVCKATRVARAWLGSEPCKQRLPPRGGCRGIFVFSSSFSEKSFLFNRSRGGCTAGGCFFGWALVLLQGPWVCPGWDAPLSVPQSCSGRGNTHPSMQGLSWARCREEDAPGSVVHRQTHPTAPQRHGALEGWGKGLWGPPEKLCFYPAVGHWVCGGLQGSPAWQRAAKIAVGLLP